MRHLLIFATALGLSCGGVKLAPNDSLPDAGEDADGGAVSDAGADLDGGPADAGAMDGGEPDAGVEDAGSSDAGLCTPDTWGNFVEAMANTQCNSCHTYSHGYSYSSFKFVPKVHLYIQNSAMPRSPQALTSDERARILKWFDCGLPE